LNYDGEFVIFEGATTERCYHTINDTIYSPAGCRKDRDKTLDSYTFLKNNLKKKLKIIDHNYRHTQSSVL
jgi:hypothetical protein